MIGVITANTTYQVSNKPEDNGCPYVVEDNGLYILLTKLNEPPHTTMIPYDMIVNIVYNDTAGEELATLILSKKQKNGVVRPSR
jgi:hypothetical protein